MEIINDTEKAVQVFNALKSNELNLRREPVAARKEKLKRLLSNIERYSARIEEAIFADFHKPAVEVRLTEIFPVTSEIKHVVRNLTAWAQEKRTATPITFFGASSKVVYKPKGIVLIISPWNYPFQLAVGPLVSALAAGNGAVLKPSELSPNTSAVIAELIAETFSEDEVTVLQGGKEIAQTLLDLPFDHIFFTGSTSIGKIVMEKAAQHLSGVTLELGGKSPVIIDSTADLKDAAQKVAWGKYLNAGQTCIAPDYVLIPEEKKAEFVKLLKSNILKLYGDVSEIDKNPDYCHIVNENHLRMLENLTADAVNKGAKIEVGGKTLEGNTFQPTLLTNVSLDTEIMKNEIFGPVLPVLDYKTEEEFYNIIGENPNPLALYIFSKNKKFTDKIINEIPSGGAAINDVVVHFANYGLPFGGVKGSGFGKGHGYYGFLEFSHERSVMKQKKFTTIKMFYPPYTKSVKKLIDLIIKFF